MLACVVLLVVLCAPRGSALTLAEAQALALKNNPALPAQTYNTEAARQMLLEMRSAYFPTLTTNITGATALDNTRIAAGALNNPIIFPRVAGGVTASQLVADFGRTGNLNASARLRFQSEQQNTQWTRAEVLLRVTRAYFAALRAQALERVATETVGARQTVLDQITALANSKLKSGLDVSFANVQVQDAKLLLLSAQNQTQAAMAELSAAMGFRDQRLFPLAEEPLPASTTDAAEAYIQQALQKRPDVLALRLQRLSLWKFADAEKDLNRPTVSALGTFGGIPAHDEHLAGRYGAAGVNLSIPVFNGGLFRARHEEAVMRAKSQDERLRALEDTVARDVRLAWLDANTARQRMDVTAVLVASAREALDLAQSRYNLGLGSIVELSQAQLNVTSAEIAVASARYDYELQLTVLNYQTGTLQ